MASITDLRKSKIPNYITLPGIGTGILYLIYISQESFLVHISICALLMILTLPLFAIKAMGAGDIKLMIMISLFLKLEDTLLSLIIGLGLAVIYSFTKLLVNKEVKERIKYFINYFYALRTGIWADGYIQDEEKIDAKDYNVHLSVWITLGVIFCLVLRNI